MRELKTPFEATLRAIYILLKPLGGAVAGANCRRVLNSLRRAKPTDKRISTEAASRRPDKLQSSRRTAAETTRRETAWCCYTGPPTRSRREAIPDELDVLPTEPNLNGKRVILAGSAGYLDGLTRHIAADDALVNRTYDTAESGESSGKMRDLSTLVYFVAHDIHRADMEQILHKHPAHSFEYLWMERSNVRAVQTMQTTALTYMKKLVEETYEQKMADHTDITRMSNANRRDNLWVPMWRKDKMTLVKGMYGSMDKVIDFEVILDPPNDLDDELARKLQAWRTYLMWCFILSAEASLKMQLVPEYLGRATGGVPQGESVYNHWKRLVREDYIIIPDLKTLPVTSGKDAANKRRKVAVKTGHSFVPITGLQG